ncbi:hypothetical protein JY440_10820 [Stenotrophomonas maltophilia]|nr:hypothetical protein [Stenotrophomonas pavanii]MBH1541105.1 hypothetical protein [Stenotrophomonas maltophilia]MBN4983682.1 hypothetical protein [Stenotrophomonas maltophilia]
MYRWVSRFISYRTFYLWRARYYYYARNLDRWVLFSLLCLVSAALVLWYHWRVASVPPPRVHPEAAAVRVENITQEAIHRIVVVRHGGPTPGEPLTTPEDVRASTLRTLRVRQLLDSAMVWQLKAHMLADMAAYIDITGSCFPFPCWQVSYRLQLMREAEAENAAINQALESVLEVPLNRMPNLDGGERTRLQTAWSDPFGDVYNQTWLLGDLQNMHARMMVAYPQRAGAPWLARLLSGDAEEPYRGW